MADRDLNALEAKPALDGLVEMAFEALSRRARSGSITTRKVALAETVWTAAISRCKFRGQMKPHFMWRLAQCSVEPGLRSRL